MRGAKARADRSDFRVLFGRSCYHRAARHFPPPTMSRELDSLIDKLTRINQDMGGDEGKKKKKGENADRFHDLKNQVAERLHRLKFVRGLVVLYAVLTRLVC